MDDLAVRLDRATCNRQTFVYHADSLLQYTQGDLVALLDRATCNSLCKL